MLVARLAGLAAALLLPLTLLAGPAHADDPDRVLAPEPTVAQLSLTSPKVTLTMSTSYRHLDGTPVAGVQLVFTHTRPTSLFDRDLGKVFLCSATTDANGFASCKGSGTLGAVLSLLVATYVTDTSTGNNAKMPVIVTGP
jgi:hypothetical protein